MAFGAANSASTRCRGGIGMDELAVSPPILIDLPLASFGEIVENDGCTSPTTVGL
jgi:hypothetical protein